MWGPVWYNPLKCGWIPQPVRWQCYANCCAAPPRLTATYRWSCALAMGPAQQAPGTLLSIEIVFIIAEAHTTLWPDITLELTHRMSAKKLQFFFLPQKLFVQFVRCDGQIEHRIDDETCLSWGIENNCFKSPWEAKEKRSQFLWWKRSAFPGEWRFWRATWVNSERSQQMGPDYNNDKNNLW